MTTELHQFLDTANILIFGIDVNEHVNEWNVTTAEITEFSKEEVFENPLVSKFIVPNFCQSVQDVMGNALKGNGPSNYDVDFLTKTGKTR